ncbi:MAG TPA: ROK family protein [Solirubrobacterales bacterium]|nr:ROK family protein [Solirubrobacterales bacterium]
MPLTRVQIAHGLTLHGQQLAEGVMDRRAFRDLLDCKDTTFHSATKPLGGYEGDDGIPGSSFFEASDGKLKFGPGAGVVLGVSLGIANVRAALFDANGDMHHETTLERMPKQMEVPPADLLRRIEEAATQVMVPALEDESLQVAGGKLRFRGVAVAWPCPLGRDKKPSGHFLHSAWAHLALDQSVAKQLGLRRAMSHALNDTYAGAIAVAFNHTRAPEHTEQDRPELTLVLRISGGISGSTIVIEAPKGNESGFARSILLGGVNSHAGEVGHASINPGLIAEITPKKSNGLGAPTPIWCSCTHPSHQDPPSHLEAYAGRLALANRIDSGRDAEDVIQDVLQEPESKVHLRALGDVGTMTGDVLRGAAAMLNPAKIVITGSLALEPVRDAMNERLEEEHRVSAHPQVVMLERDEDFIGAKGAALAVIRRQVYRKFESLLAPPVNEIPQRLQSGQHVEDISTLPWKKRSQ